MKALHFTISNLAGAFIQSDFTNEDNGRNQNRQKSNDMQVLLQVSVSFKAVHVASFFIYK